MSKNYALADQIQAIKDRMQFQQQVVQAANSGDVKWTRGDIKAMRAELDALWTCVETLTMVLEGFPAEFIRPRDHFREGGHLGAQ